MFPFDMKSFALENTKNIDDPELIAEKILENEIKSLIAKEWNQGKKEK